MNVSRAVYIQQSVESPVVGVSSTVFMQKAGVSRVVYIQQIPSYFGGYDAELVSRWSQVQIPEQHPYLEQYP